MFKDKDKYTSHIKEQDKIFEMRKVIDKIEIVTNNHIIESTDFLDPYEIRLAKSILNRFSEISYLEQGGHKNPERKIIVIYPFYQGNYNIRDYIVTFRITGSLNDLTHKDYLGAILNLGIKRNKIGDILVHENFGYITVKEEISDFIQLNLERIGNQKINIETIDSDCIEPLVERYREIKTTLMSNRLDVYLSSAYNLSRQKSSDLIKGNFVKVNWEPISKLNKELSVGDIISVRGYGRSILYSEDGLSRKGKIKANIRILI